MNRHDRIGVFDSGVGGLELMDQLQRLMPEEEIYYFADTVNHPYGTKSPAEVEKFLTGIVEGMLLRRVKLLVIACNTASSVFLSLPDDHPLKRRLRREGVDAVPMALTEAVAELISHAPRRVLLAATPLTIRSGIYQSMIARLIPEATVLPVAAPEWVERVEHPDPDPDAEEMKRRAAVAEVLDPLTPPPDAIFLGCTHFPRLTGEIRRHLKSPCVILNPALPLAHFVRNHLDVRGLSAPAHRRTESLPVVFTNGPEKDIEGQLARMGLGGRYQVRQVDIRNDLSGKAVDVVGYGVTGRSLVRHLVSTGHAARITVRDRAPDLASRLAADFPGSGVAVIGGDRYLDDLERADVVFRSPGVPADQPCFENARRQGVPVMGDIDLFLRHAPGRKVAITGTNGKTTTTILTHKLFEAHLGADAHMVGNIGLPVLDHLHRLGPQSVCAIELSSFQLEELTALPAQVAILLNITPDHLDRHGDMKGYILAKGRIFTLLEENAFAVYNIDSEEIVNVLLPQGCKARMIPFSRRRTLQEGAFLDGSDLVFRVSGFDELRLRSFTDRARYVGEHNLENLMSSGLAALLMGVPPDRIARIVESFRGVVHRIEHAFRFHGVDYYNDSKGTNPDATIKALESLKNPIRLVAGGNNKGYDFSEVASSCRGRVVSAYLFGEIAPLLAESLARLDPPIPFETSEDLESATQAAAREARPGEAVLFSPASASPPGQKYTTRGKRFKEEVARLGVNELSDPGFYLPDPLEH